MRIPGALRALDHHDLRGGAAPGWRHRALRHQGAINGPSFQTYVAKCLAPTLCPGDIVVMDNLGSHKSQKVRAAIEARNPGTLVSRRTFQSQLAITHARGSSL